MCAIEIFTQLGIGGLQGLNIKGLQGLSIGGLQGLSIGGLQGLNIGGLPGLGIGLMCGSLLFSGRFFQYVFQYWETYFLRVLIRSLAGYLVRHNVLESILGYTYTVKLKLQSEWDTLQLRDSVCVFK